MVLKIGLTASVLAIVHVPAFAADFTKVDNNTTALNLAGAWSNGDEDGIPDADDTLVWDSSFTAKQNPRTAGVLSPLGGNLSVFGIRIANVSGTRNAASTAVGFQNASSANTLTIGAGGIDMSSALHAFYLESKIALSADQNWIISNANTNGSPVGFGNAEDLAFRAQVASTAFNLGGFTLNTSGLGAVTISSGYAITNGSINIGNTLFLIAGGDSRAVTLGSDVNLNVATGSTLHFQSNSAGVTSAANMTLDGGTLRLVSGSTSTQLTFTGTTTVASASTLLVGNKVDGTSFASTNGILFNANLAGSAPLTVTNSATEVSMLVMGGNNSAYSGTLTFGGTTGRVTRLTTANSGSAAATWSVSSGHTLQVNGVNVDLGTLNGAGTINSSTGASTINVGSGDFSGAIVDGSGTMGLTKSTGGTLTLTGANTYTGPTNVNAGTLLVSPGVLSGTAVSVASGATLVAQASNSGTLNTSIALTNGATMLVRPLAVGTSVTVPSLTTGTTTGGTLVLDTGLLGNPTAAPLIPTVFNPAAGTTIRVLGTNLTAGTFPAIGYTTLGGGGFAALTLSLPFRISGSLVNNPNSIAINITGAAKPTWRGGINGNWDVDTSGNGSAGTANWFASAGPNTYVESATLGNDTVVFDDSVTGTPNVNLTATVSPNNISVNNTVASYRFGGSGKISGSGILTKSGTGTLTVANTGTNDYTGGTIISGGTLRLGDGSTSGAGTLGAGVVTVNSPGNLELNRPDDFSIANAFSGTGTITKSQQNLATIQSSTTFGGGVTVNGGTLEFGAGATLSGTVTVGQGTLKLSNASTISGTLTGTGTFEVAGGTAVINGTTANTNTGETLISGGSLRLSKGANVQAIGGDITILGNGVLAILADEQIADTATINFYGTSTDATVGTTGKETIANLNVNAGSSEAQFQLRNGFNVIGKTTLSNGYISITSGSTNTLNALEMSGGRLRIAGNTNASTLNIGAGGINASGGEIQVKYNTNNFDAVLNLGGNFTATGNVSFTNGNYTGTNLNVINLTATRTFDIAEGTTTTIAPDIAGPGGLVKTGTGTLSLTSSSAATYNGPTVIENGTLGVAGSISGTPSITVKQGATLDVAAADLTLEAGQRLTGSGTVFGNLFLGAGAELEPGDGIGTLTFDGGLDLTLAVTPPGAGALNFDLGSPSASDKVAFIFAGLTVGTGVLDFDDFVFTLNPGFGSGVYTLFSGDSAIIGSLDSNTANLTGQLGSGFSGKIELRDGGTDLVLVVAPVPEPGTAATLLTGLGALMLTRRRRRVA